MDKIKKLRRFWKNKRVFITGHTGFKGSWLCIMLKIFDAKIYGYSLPFEKDSLFDQAGLKTLISKNYFKDIRDYSSLNNSIQKTKPQIIFHLASQAIVSNSFINPHENFDTNLNGTLNLLEIIRKNRLINSALFITTDKVYKNDNKKIRFKEKNYLEGKDPYSASKVCQEILTSAYEKSFFSKTMLKGKISTVRSGNVIGGGDYSHDRLVPDILRALTHKKDVIIRNPKHIRPWQHVIEPLYGYLLLAQKQYENQLLNKEPIWNFGPRRKNFVNVKKICEVFNKYEKKLKTKFVKKSYNKYNESKILMLDSEKSRKFLGWEPILNIDQSIYKILEWNYLKKKKGVYETSVKQIKDYFKLLK